MVVIDARTECRREFGRNQPTKKFTSTSCMSDAQIERFWGNRCLVPALRAIGQSRQVAARQELQPHRESNIEIHLIMDGSVNWWVEDEQFFLPPDSIFVTQPMELHGGVKNMVQPSSLLWLQVKPDMLQSDVLASGLLSLDRRKAKGAHLLRGFVYDMLAECREPRSDSAVAIEANLNLFLVQMLRQFEEVEVPAMYPKPMRDMLTLIESNIERMLTIDEICNTVHLSRSRVFQMFDEYLGQSPIAYATTLRIQRAKQLLKESPDSITMIAQSLGFSSSQHFATAFRRVTGVTPSAFRKD